MSKVINFPVNINGIVLHKFQFVNNKGETRTHARKLVVKKIPESPNGSILFYVYEPDDTEYGIMAVSIDEFNKNVKTGEFKIAS